MNLNQLKGKRRWVRQGRFRKKRAGFVDLGRLEVSWGGCGMRWACGAASLKRERGGRLGVCILLKRDGCLRKVFLFVGTSPIIDLNYKRNYKWVKIRN